MIKSEFDGYYNGLIERMWQYAKMSGLRERAGIAETEV